MIKKTFVFKPALLAIAMLSMSSQPAECSHYGRTLAEQEELGAEFSECNDIRAKIVKAAHLKESEAYSPQRNACAKLVSMFGTRHVWCNLTLEPNGRIAKLSIDHRAEAKSVALNSKALDLIRSAGPFMPVKAKKRCYVIDLPLLLVNPGPDTEKR